jgi:NitT/TauT family transport system substrate-binding protein
MSTHRVEGWTRRRFLGGLTVVGTAGLLGLSPRRVAAEPPPETTRLRLGRLPGICGAPLVVAEEFLPAEGFTEVQYVTIPSTEEAAKALAAGRLDFTIYTAGLAAVRLDAGDPFLLLVGLHVGCFELFGTDRVHTIRDLKGKTVALPEPLGSPGHILVASMAAYVGLDPHREIQWAFHPTAEAKQLLAAASCDGSATGAYVTQRLRVFSTPK